MNVVSTKYSDLITIQHNIHQYLGKKEIGMFTNMDPMLKGDWLSGRIALKQAFLNNFSLPKRYASEITVYNLPNGQPYISKYNRLFCSIAHSNNWGIGAVSDTPIGVDIEKIKIYKRHLIDYIADKEEINLLRSIHKDLNELMIAMWTIKEAVLKGLGQGFNFPPKGIKIRSMINNMSVIEVLNKNTRWKVVTYRKEKFLISIAFLASMTYNKCHEEAKISWYNPAIL